MDKHFVLITTRDYPGIDRKKSSSWVEVNGFQSFLKEIAQQIDIADEIKQCEKYNLNVNEELRFKLAMFKLFSHKYATWTEQKDAFNKEILCYKRSFDDFEVLVMPCTGDKCLPDGVRERYLVNCVKLITNQFSISESNLVIIAHSKDVGWKSENPGFVGEKDIQHYKELARDISKYRIYAYHHFGDVYNDIVSPVCKGDKVPVLDKQKFFPVVDINHPTETISLWDKMKALNDES